MRALSARSPGSPSRQRPPAMLQHRETSCERIDGYLVLPCGQMTLEVTAPQGIRARPAMQVQESCSWPIEFASVRFSSIPRPQIRSSRRCAHPRAEARCRARPFHLAEHRYHQSPRIRAGLLDWGNGSPCPGQQRQTRRLGHRSSCACPSRPL